MKRYVVRVEETLSRTYVVKAENEHEAYNKICDAYENGDIHLDHDDYSGWDIEVKREATEDELMYYDIFE